MAVAESLRTRMDHASRTFVDHALVSRLSLKQICCLIFVFALGMRLVLIAALGTYLRPSGAEIYRIAMSLVTTGVFGNPYNVPTGPSAHSAPLYPFILYIVYSIFGVGVTAEVVHQILNAVLASTAYALLPAIAVTFGLSLHVGVIAGLAAAFFPIHILNEVRGAEASATAAALSALTLLTFRSWQRQQFSSGLAAVQGVCWGGALLLSPSLLTVLVGVLLAPFRFAYSKKRVVAYSAILVFVAVATVSPWTIRNYLRLGSPVFVRDNFGFELSFSNSPRAQPTVDGNYEAGVFRADHPYTSRVEAMKVREIGEIAYNSAKLDEAMEWIRSNPSDFLRLTVLRFVYFWFPQTTRPTQSFLLWVLTLAAVVGLWRLFKVNRLAAIMMLTLWVSFPWVYYLVQADVRYRYPIHWTFFLLGSVGADSLVGKMLNAWTSKRNVPLLAPRSAAVRD